MDTIKTFDNASIEGKLGTFEEAYNGWIKSNAALIERDNRIAELEASLTDAREANALAANVIKESQRDVDIIRELRTQLAQAETAANASARMASEQAAKSVKYFNLLYSARIAITFYREWMWKKDGTSYPYGTEIEDAIREATK